MTGLSQCTPALGPFLWDRDVLLVSRYFSRGFHVKRTRQRIGDLDMPVVADEARLRIVHGNGGLGIEWCRTISPKVLTDGADLSAAGRLPFRHREPAKATAQARRSLEH